MRTRSANTFSVRRGLAVALLSCVFVILSCRTTPKISPELAKLPAPKPPEGYRPPEVVQLDMIGENCCAQWVGNKAQIVFLSRKRPRHAHFQVYIYDLEAKKDRRISFHDGDDQGPQVHAATGDFFYASLTDTLKESPRFLQEALGRPMSAPANLGQRPLWGLESFDLYRSKRDGTGIERLTNEAGFDGELRLHPKSEFMIHSSVRDGQSKLVRRENHGRDSRVLTRVKESESEAAFSPSGKEFAWVRYSLDFKTSQIWIANLDGTKARALTNGPGLRWSPTWSPDGRQILFSSNQDEEDNFELYSIQLDGGCLRRLTYSLGQDVLPAWGTGERPILFSSDRSGAFQLYTLSYSPPACP